MLDNAARTTHVSIIGFDSAWTDHPKKPGAICVIRLADRTSVVEPVAATFDQALGTIQNEREVSPLCLVALDQPTIVINAKSLRPVERVASSIISWVGGGVQPANRSKVGMFDDAAPLWRFKKKLSAIEMPELARTADAGLFLIEVFPALALLSIDEKFHVRLGAPKYNPERRKKFKAQDYLNVLDAVGRFAEALGVSAIAAWCTTQRFLAPPRKADQDKLDSVICALVGLHWMISDRSNSVMIGDLDSGYMIAPVSPGIREKLKARADICRVAVDGLEFGKF
jgi:predicted RNase H-like nuclease